MADHLTIADRPMRYASSSDIAEKPAEYAGRLHARYAAAALEQDRRDFGQFFTSVAVARMMARLAAGTDAETLRVVEPGAGAAVLTAALCESLPSSVRQLHIFAFELHPTLADLCEETLAYSSRWLEDRGVESTFTVHRKDFVFANAARLTARLFDESRDTYDIAIANPPYFKLQKQDPRTLAASEIVHGQPNIYAIFMAIMASLLAQNGTMVTITPRSFTAGDYFRRFREVLFENHLNYIHRPKGSIAQDEAFGLAALLNSVIVDRYFRVSNGNTQVSAAELRKLPLPSIDVLKTIGRAVQRDGDSLDRTVADALHVPAKLRRELERGVDAEG